MITNNIIKSIGFVAFLQVFALLSANTAFTQTGSLSGKVSTPNNPVQFATVQIEGTSMGAMTNPKGNFEILKIPFGKHNVVASFIGYKDVIQEIEITETQNELKLDFQFTSTAMELDEIVVSGTKTFKRQTDSPIIVNVLNSKTLDNVQACNLSEGLKFQPGLRVEVDCQTCNYTQLRMNGLAGGHRSYPRRRIFVIWIKCHSGYC